MLLPILSDFQCVVDMQGYWPDGIYTAPTDAALKYDIEASKEMGFNMLRKHIKVEPDRHVLTSIWLRHLFAFWKIPS